MVHVFTYLVVDFFVFAFLSERAVFVVATLMFFKIFQMFLIFLTPENANLRPLFPLATAHRGANPLACASALSILRTEKSEKQVLMTEKSRKLKKTAPIFRIVL